MSDYKVGTPADIYYADTKVRGLRVPGGWSLETDWASFLSDDVVSDVRPLVVLDLSRREADELTLWLRKQIRGAGSLAERVADQIDAQSRPPKPPEPQGLGAVVEDSEGRLWTNTGRDMPNRWACSTEFGFVNYDELNPVRVLSDGWEPKP